MLAHDDGFATAAIDRDVDIDAIAAIETSFFVITTRAVTESAHFFVAIVRATHARGAARVEKRKIHISTTRAG